MFLDLIKTVKWSEKLLYILQSMGLDAVKVLIIGVDISSTTPFHIWSAGDLSFWTNLKWWSGREFLP